MRRAVKSATATYLVVVGSVVFPLLWAALVLGLALPKTDGETIDDFATSSLGWSATLPLAVFALFFAVYGVVITVGALIVAYDQPSETWQVALLSTLAMGVPSAFLLCAFAACFTPNKRLRSLVAGTVYYSAASRLRSVWAGALVVVTSVLTLLVGGALWCEEVETPAIVCFAVGGAGLLVYAVLVIRNAKQETPSAGPLYAPFRVWLGAAPQVAPVAARFRPTPSVFKRA